MSSCQCCLTSHPSRLIERFNVSIQMMKLIRKSSLIFENILIEEHEQIERLLSKFNKHLMYNTKTVYLSQFTSQLKMRLETITKLLYELECLTIKCLIWSKNHSTKSIRSQLKHSRKQLDLFIDFKEQNSSIISYKTKLSRKFSKDFSLFQSNYQQLCLQMDTIEQEYMKIFIESMQLFSKIIPSENQEKISLSMINIQENINEWKDKNKFHISWLPNEHHHRQTETDQIHVEQSLSDIEIKAIDNATGDNEAKFVHKSNLSWSFTLAKKKEESLIPSFVHLSNENPKLSQPIINIIKSTPINRVRLAIEAIERNTKYLPRERKS
ncbi:hypothetical protein I4U23_029715 [Adineta vaga]|nr:hypothetical protein I4U23_029715 [Adineta vaga]